MKRLLLLLLLAGVCFAARPVIFDTDMGNDVDDALALGMLHALTSRGECQLIGVTLTNAHSAAVPYVKMVNRFYGRGDLPVGAAMRALNGGTQDGYLSAALREAPERYRNGDNNAQPAVMLLRRLLAGSGEKVTIVQTGFSTNLAGLLDSKADEISPLDGMALVREKVALVVAMAGDFSGGGPEYNVRIDVASAQKVFERWPTPVIFSGFEIGRDLLYPAAAIERDFQYAKWHPLAASYRAYKKMPYDRPTWDLTAVLEAVRPGYFGHSATGTVTVAADGATKFAAGPGDRRYLRLDAARSGEILAVLELLASEPPLSR
jgi:inosine-uridine nucleoside N-ribohydrolase